MTAVITVIGRILFALVFLNTIFGHFSDATVKLAESRGVPFAHFLVPVSSILAVIGGLLILVGYRARLGAWLLVLFLLPVTFTIHAYWDVKDPVMRKTQQQNFLKNISLLGAALMITQVGSGPGSIKK